MESMCGGSRGFTFGPRCVPLAVLALTVAGISGCTVSDASGGRAVEDGAVAEAPGMDAPDAKTPHPTREQPGLGASRSRTPGGVEVVLRRADPATGPLEAGPVRWTIETSASPERPPTVDLVSPEMPMHGIMRYTASASDDGAWEVEVPIPMEGRWMLYVNLDDGAEAAEFTLDVAPGAGGAHDHH